MSIDWSVQCHDALDSTQSYIKTLPLHEGLVVLAKVQSNGYGRHGRSWEPSDGNLYFSFAIKPDCNLRFLGHLSILTSVALYETLSAYVDPKGLKLKWPNDVLLNGKKCSGILIDIEDVQDNIIKSAVIGIGVNVASSPLDISTCLKNFFNNDLSCEDILKEFLRKFADIYKDWKSQGIERSYNKYCDYHLSNKEVTSVKIGSKIICGRCEGIDTYGNLRLIDERDNTVRVITSGEVILTQQV